MPDCVMTRFRVRGRKHVQERSQECITLSRVQSLNSLVLINVKHHVVGRANNVLVSACTTLSCRLFLILFMCLFLQHEIN